ncbi:kirola-like [Actinidia eriantha]|uniref:kirola-like n=1 Tax=Actinidia eriantha TaxID=165200 RepID=UPI002589CBDA|nr:kirola-like [Actinidia eriantha]
MDLSGKLVINVEIKSPSEVFLDIFGTKKHELPKVAPDFVQSLELLKGEWGAVGCTLLSTFFLDGKVMFSEENIVAVDKENKSITYNIYGGDLIQLYKKLHVTFQATTQNETNFLTWIYEYERLNENVPAPHKLVEYVTGATKSIDNYYLNLKAKIQA